MRRSLKIAALLVNVGRLDVSIVRLEKAPELQVVGVLLVRRTGVQCLAVAEDGRIHIASLLEQSCRVYVRLELVVRVLQIVFAVRFWRVRDGEWLAYGLVGVMSVIQVTESSFNY